MVVVTAAEVASTTNEAVAMVASTAAEAEAETDSTADEAQAEAEAETALTASKAVAETASTVDASPRACFFNCVCLTRTHRAFRMFHHLIASTQDAC